MHTKLVMTTFTQRSTKKWSGHGLTSLTGSYSPEYTYTCNIISFKISISQSLSLSLLLSTPLSESHIHIHLHSSLIFSYTQSNKCVCPCCVSENDSKYQDYCNSLSPSGREQCNSDTLCTYICTYGWGWAKLWKLTPWTHSIKQMNTELIAEIYYAFHLLYFD